MSEPEGAWGERPDSVSGTPVSSNAPSANVGLFPRPYEAP